MKRYLNKQEKNEVSICLNFLSFLEKHVVKQKQLGRPTRWYKTATSFLSKAVNETMDSLDVDEARLARRNFAKMHLVLKTSKEALQEIKQMKEDDMVVPLKNDQFLTLCSFALGTCGQCICNDFRSCELRDIFMEYDIEPISTATDGCQYNLNELKENACFNLYDANGIKVRVQPGVEVDWKLIQKAPLPEKYWNCLKVTV